MYANSNANIPMSRDSHEKLWQALYAMLAFTIGIFGWYMNRLVGEVDKANEGIQVVSVQVARLETQVDGIEKRLDERASIEPRNFRDRNLAVNSRQGPSVERSKDESR